MDWAAKIRNEFSQPLIGLLSFLLYSTNASFLATPSLETPSLLFPQYPVILDGTWGSFLIYGLIFLSSRKVVIYIHSASWRFSGTVVMSTMLFPPGSAWTTASASMAPVRSHPSFLQLGTATDYTWTALCIAGDQLIPTNSLKEEYVLCQKFFACNPTVFLEVNSFDPSPQGFVLFCFKVHILWT